MLNTQNRITILNNPHTTRHLSAFSAYHTSWFTPRWEKNEIEKNSVPLKSFTSRAYPHTIPPQRRDLGHRW